jgi:hypothetical protein
MAAPAWPQSNTGRKCGTYSAAIETRPHHGNSRCFISREQLGHAERRLGLFLENCRAAPDVRSCTQGHIRTGLRLHSHIVDRHRSVFRSSLFLGGWNNPCRANTVLMR